VRDLLARLAPYLEVEVATFVHEAGVPGAAAAAVVRGERPWSFAYGVADAASGGPLSPASGFRVGSLTKPFTAAAILRLRDDGALSLDDPVVAHLPEFARVRSGASADPSAARVRDLVTHRAGLPGEVHALDEAGDRYPSIGEILDALGELSLLTPPGTAMRYSNLGYQLLGEIVARRAGVAFETFCAQALFGPLGLSASSFDRPAGAVQGHRARAFTDRVLPARDRRKRTNADGGLWSTAEDHARWIAAHVADGSAFTEMHGPIDRADGGPGQGLGWFRERRDARTLVYHQGSTPGFAARLAFSPTLGGGAVVLANGETSTVDALGRIVDLVLDGVEGALPSEPAPAVPPAPAPRPYPAAWDAYVGFYVWPGSAMLFRLEVRAGELRLVDLHAAEHPVSLEPVDGDTFVATDGGWAGERVAIRRADDGRVVGLRIGPWSVARLVEAAP
jgi:CubicO group peptidase (beta-lactamase class C family)